MAPGIVSGTQVALVDRGIIQQRVTGIGKSSMNVHARRRAALAFRVAQPKSSRLSSRAESLKYWGVAYPSLAPIHARGGGRIRTI